MASGYDISSNVPYRLMKGRLGVYDKRPFDPSGAMTKHQEQEEKISNFLAGMKSANIELEAETIQKIRELLLQDKNDEIKTVLNALDPGIQGIWDQATRFRQAGGNR